MRNNIFLLFLFFFFACSTQTHHIEPVPLIKIRYQELHFPDWFMNFPQEEHLTIGFAYKTNDNTMLEEAKESAAIFYSRNRASINIKKYAGNYDAHASFELIVSSKPEELRKLANSMHLIDSFYLNHYFVALFSLSADSYATNNLMISNQTLSQPDWFDSNNITLKNEKIYSVASASASDLLFAWKLASEKALLQIADYVTKEVRSKHLMIDDRNYKFISVETATVIDNIKPQHIFVSTKIKDSLPSYSVFILLTIQ